MYGLTRRDRGSGPHGIGALRTVGALVLLLAVTAGCRGGEDPRSSPSPTPTVTPVAGSVQVRALSFVPPDGLTRVAERDKQQNTNASYEMVGTAKPPTSPPRFDVFLEKGDVGSAKVRAAAIVDLANLQLDDAKIVRNERIEVPGAVDARLIEITFVCGGTTGKAKIPCRQFEVLVQTERKPQYGLRYGMPEKHYDKAAVDELTRSLRVTG